MTHRLGEVARRWWAPLALVLASITTTVAARGDGPFVGETAVTLWIHRHSPGPIDQIVQHSKRIVTGFPKHPWRVLEDDREPVVRLHG